jgi:uncharacterized protein YjiS (DUF1127 family)
MAGSSMMSANMSGARSAGLADPPAAPPAQPVVVVRRTLGLWSRRWRFRRELTRLAATGDHLLRDAGFDPHWAQAEMAKPVWRG